jgi:hypothetical protein
MAALRVILQEAIGGAGDRVVVVSQSTAALDLVQQLCDGQGFKTVRIDGATDVTKRQVCLGQGRQGTSVGYRVCFCVCLWQRWGEGAAVACTVNIGQMPCSRLACSLTSPAWRSGDPAWCCCCCSCVRHGSCDYTAGPKQVARADLYVEQRVHLFQSCLS